MPEEPITTDEKRQALAELLASKAMARSDQLRHFLSYLGDCELEGRGEEINEYEIAVRVFGKSNDFTAAEDATVRNRAFSLRKKLEEHYARENPSTEVVVELPKGDYRLRFRRAGPSPGIPVAARREARPWKLLAVAFAAGAILAGLGATLFQGLQHQAVGSNPPVVAEAWGPLLRSEGDPVVCLSVPSHMIVRQFDSPDKPWLPSVEAPAVLDQWFTQTNPVPRHGKLYLEPTMNSPLWGDAMVAATLMRVFTRAALSPQILPERVLRLAAIKKRNTFVVGTPEFSRIVAYHLRETPLSIDRDPKLRSYYVVDRQAPAGTTPKYWNQPILDRKTSTDYGLVTVLREGAADSPRTVIFSGLTSAGSLAAAEFFSSPAHLEDLRRRFHAAGMAGFPASYQVLVRCDHDGALTLFYRYELHRILRP